MTTIPIQIVNGRVEISVGDARASAPEHLIEPMIRLLEASLAVIRVSRGEAGAPQNSVTSRPAYIPPPVFSPSGYQRKSRKPVTPALMDWMSTNPGWKGEEELLEAVVRHHMTDANPRRALKIALGKGRGKTFEPDGSGRWRLLAPNPVVTPKVKRGPGRPRGSRTRPPKKRMTESLVDWMRLNPGWRSMDELRTAAIANQMTRADPNLAVRIALGRGVGAGIFVSDGGEMWRLSEDRTSGATVPDGDVTMDLGSQDAGAFKRWRSAAGGDVKRAKKNLLGISGSEASSD